MSAAPTPAPGRRPRLLLYAMYDPSGLDSAPKVRIAMIAAALEGIADVERLQGGRTERMRAGLRWLRGRGVGSVDAVYVESSTTPASPFDLAFLLWARLRGRPVGIYFRDAYQLFRDLYPPTRRRQPLGDLAWKASVPLLRSLASVRFAPTAGLAQLLGLDRPVLLPPGTDPALPDLGPGSEPLVAYVGATGSGDGYDRLLEAMRIVRERIPVARLLLVAPSVLGDEGPPDYVEHVRASRPALPEVLRPARACVIPRPVNRYTDVAVPVKLMDYLAMGKPVVATDARETRRIVESSGGGIVVDDDPAAIADGLLRVLEDPVTARSMAERARSFAIAPANTWEARARTIVGSLVGQAT